MLPVNPLFAYGTILLLQLRRMWSIWRWHELTGGDTCAYFYDASSWFRHGQGNFGWSPLYTYFYGSLLHLTTDAAVVTALHRLIIACLATLGVLSVMRRMLPPALAWLVAAWWAVLPVNFNTTFEVHLFSLLPILAALIVILYGRGPWARAGAVSVLVLSAFLVRNEMLVGAGLLLLICIGWEVRDFRRGRRRLADIPMILAAYFIMGAVTGCIVWWFFSHSNVKGDAFRDEMRSKHTVNMAQVYAYGYQQRHPEWSKNPWVDYGELCQRDFGTPLPTLAQMMRRNPRVYVEHVLWNYRLLPAGLQLMLFSATSGHVDPDYLSPYVNRSRVNWQTWAFWLSVATTALIAWGLVRLWGERKYWWPTLIRPRLEGWLTIGCVMVVALLVVVPTQRPRPAYLFGLTVGLMCLVATCAVLVFGRLAWLRRLAPAMPILMLALPFAVPSAYGNRKHHGPRPMYDDYERLHPFEQLLARPDASFVGAYPIEMRIYVGLGLPSIHHVHGYQLFKELGPREPLADFMNSRGISVAEFDDRAVGALESEHPGDFAEFLRTGGTSGWKLAASERKKNRSWYLFYRAPATAAEVSR